MVIQHNLSSMNTNRQLSCVTKSTSKSTEKLSSGYKINRAADDAAGLSISEKMRSQIRGLNRASANAQDGISLIQVAEGALGETHAILQRMNELATQAANDTNTTTDRNAIKSEIDQLASEINRISSTTQFNTMNLLDGTFKDKNLQIGSLSGQKINLNLYALDTHGLGLNTPFNQMNDREWDSLFKREYSVSNIEKDKEMDTAYEGYGVYLLGDMSKKGPYNPDLCLSVSTFKDAGRTMKLVQNAVELVSEMRSELGAIQNRLDHTINNLNTTAENVSAAESRIRDTDMANEMVEFSRNNILSQVGQSMLSQANQSTQGVLSLLS